MLPGPELLNALASKFDQVWLASEGREIMVTCPNCHFRGMSRDKSGHLALNFGKNVAHCVRCDWGHRDLRDWLKKWQLGVHIPMGNRSIMELMAPVKKAEEPEFQELTFPDNCRPMSVRDTSTDFGKSLMAKGLDPEDWIEAGAHACGGGWLDGFVLFPFYERGRLVYWQARAAREDIPPERRKQNPAKVHLGKSHWLYGFDHNLPRGREVTLTEGTLDKISAQKYLRSKGDNIAVSLQGTALSFPTEEGHPHNSQFGKLMLLTPSKVWVMFDPDAYEKAKGLASTLQVCGLNAEAVKLTEQEGDPNEAGNEGIGAAMSRSAASWENRFEQELDSLRPT